MHSYFESKNLLQNLQSSVDAFSHTVASKDSKEIFQEVSSIQGIANKLFSGSALNPLHQKQIFLKFVKASELLQNCSLAWTEEERAKELPQKLMLMINSVKETLGLDITVSAITHHKAYIQPCLNTFLNQIKPKNLDAATTQKLRRGYINEVLYKNIHHHFTMYHNQNVMTILFRNSNQGNKNEYVISCMYIDKKTNGTIVKHVPCHAHPATNTWSLSPSDPGIYKFDQFLEHTFLPFMKNQSVNPNLLLSSSISQLTQKEISSITAQILGI